MLHLKISPWKMSCLFWKPSFSPKCIWTLPLKNVGWKTSLSYWVSGTCQGLTVKLRGGTLYKIDMEHKEMEVWKMIFLCYWVNFWFRVDFQAYTGSLNLRNCKWVACWLDWMSCPFGTWPIFRCEMLVLGVVSTMILTTGKTSRIPSPITPFGMFPFLLSLDSLFCNSQCSNTC